MFIFEERGKRPFLRAIFDQKKILQNLICRISEILFSNDYLIISKLLLTKAVSASPFRRF